ncbi:MAG: DUF5723 family protein [Candidatus Cryptobacteroides sp.]
MKKIFNIFVFSLVLGTAAFAQTTMNTAYFLDGYDFRHRLNPATPSARSYFALPAVGNTSVGVASNMGIKNFLYPTADGGLTTFMNSQVDADSFISKLNKNNIISQDLNTTVFSVGAWGKKNGFTTVELNLRETASVNLPRDLFSFMKNVGGAQSYNISNLGVKAKAYMELSLGQSQRISDKLVVGAKVKALLGVASADLTMKNLNLEMSEDKWRVEADGTLQASVGDFINIPTYGETGTVPDGKSADQIDFGSIGFNSGFKPSSVLGGFGVAFDLGFSYEIFKGLTVSAAVLDLGFIHWKSSVLASTNNNSWEFNGFDNVSLDENSPNSISNQFNKITEGLEDLTVLYKQESGAYNEMLSATINAAVEYKMPFWDGMSVGGLFTARIQGSHSQCEGRVSVNIAAGNCLGFSASYGLSNFGSSFGAYLNLHCRAIDFFVGTDSLVTNFAPCDSFLVPYKKLNLAMNFGLAFNVSKRKDNRGFIK